MLANYIFQILLQSAVFIFKNRANVVRKDAARTKISHQNDEAMTEHFLKCLQIPTIAFKTNLVFLRQKLQNFFVFTRTGVK
jgi:hypothetical protein